MAFIGSTAVPFLFWIGKLDILIIFQCFFYKIRTISSNFKPFRLVHDREVQLYDGTRLIGSDSYDQMISNGQSAEELAKNRIFRIHPSFRIVALAEQPSRKFELLRNSISQR